jgi:hypothetical protein
LYSSRLADFSVIAVADRQFQSEPSQAPTQVAASPTPLTIGTAFNTVLDLPAPVRSALAAPMAAVKAQPTGVSPSKRLLLRIVVAELNRLPTVGFDVYVTPDSNAPLTKTSPSFVGSVNLFVHAHHGEDTVTQDFDITRAAGGLDPTNLSKMHVVFAPFALTKSVETGAPNLQSEPLAIRSFEFLVVDR